MEYDLVITVRASQEVEEAIDYYDRLNVSRPPLIAGHAASDHYLFLLRNLNITNETRKQMHPLPYPVFLPKLSGQAIHSK